MRIRDHRGTEPIGAAECGESGQGGCELGGGWPSWAVEVELYGSKPLGDDAQANLLDWCSRRLRFQMQADQSQQRFDVVAGSGDRHGAFLAAAVHQTECKSQIAADQTAHGEARRDSVEQRPDHEKERLQAVDSVVELGGFFEEHG